MKQTKVTIEITIDGEAVETKAETENLVNPLAVAHALGKFVGSVLKDNAPEEVKTEYLALATKAFGRGILEQIEKKEGGDDE